jgi:hypothetical protein
MKELVLMLHDVCKTEARKSLAIEYFWQQQSHAYGLEPNVVPPELQELKLLTDYSPN